MRLLRALASGSGLRSSPRGWRARSTRRHSRLRGETVRPNLTTDRSLTTPLAHLRVTNGAQRAPEILVTDRPIVFDARAPAVDFHGCDMRHGFERLFDVRGGADFLQLRYFESNCLHGTTISPPALGAMGREAGQRGGPTAEAAW